MFSQYGELRPTNGWDRFQSLGHGTPTNFNWFRVLASLLQWRRSPEVNHTLHDVWPSPALVHYILIFGGSCPWRNCARCKVHFASCKSCLLLYFQRYCTVQLRASATLWRGARNGITELSQRAPPIFGCAAITLGIGQIVDIYAGTLFRLYGDMSSTNAF